MPNEIANTTLNPKSRGSGSSICFLRFCSREAFRKEVYDFHWLSFRLLKQNLGVGILAQVYRARNLE